MYTLQVNAAVDGQVICSGSIVFDGTYLCLTNVKYPNYVFPDMYQNTIVLYFLNVINRNIKVNIYSTDDILPYSLNYF